VKKLVLITGWQGASHGKKENSNHEKHERHEIQTKKALTLDWMAMRIGSLQALSHARE